LNGTRSSSSNRSSPAKTGIIIEAASEKEPQLPPPVVLKTDTVKAAETKTAPVSRSRIFRNDFKVIEREDPGLPMSEQAMMMKQELPASQLQSSVGSHPLVDSAEPSGTSIEGYLPPPNPFSRQLLANQQQQQQQQQPLVIQSASEIRVAPETVMSNLAHNSSLLYHGNHTKQKTEDGGNENNEDDNDDEEEDEEETDEDEDDDDLFQGGANEEDIVVEDIAFKSDASSSSSGTSSMFLSLWTTLDDIFEVDYGSPPDEAPVEDASEEVGEEVRMPIDLEVSHICLYSIFRSFVLSFFHP
jgi:hypothetical protein